MNDIKNCRSSALGGHIDQCNLCGHIEISYNSCRLNAPSNFNSLIDSLYQTEWVVYSKKPFASAAHVLRYLGRYTHRVAISNHRIISCEKGADGCPSEVTFKYRDYRDGKEKLMIITAQEFIRRFLLHILPSRFIKIRYYGLFGNRVRKVKIRICQKFLGMKLKPCLKLTTRELIIRLTGKDPCLCPACQTGHLYRSLSFPGNSPPCIWQYISQPSPFGGGGEIYPLLSLAFGNSLGNSVQYFFR